MRSSFLKILSLLERRENEYSLVADYNCSRYRRDYHCGDDEGRKVMKPVCLGLVALLVGLYIGYFLPHPVQSVSNLDKAIEELVQSEEGGVIILLSGEYESSVIYGPEGLIHWR